MTDMRTQDQERLRAPSAWTRPAPEPRVLEPLLDLDPDLGCLLREERAVAAHRDLQVSSHEVARGDWEPARHLAPVPSAIGLLVVSGIAARQLVINGEPSAELLGAGDIIRSWQGDDAPDALGCDVRWSALSPLTVSPLDTAMAISLARYPEVMLAILERIEARARRLSVTQAISQMTGVELRIESLLWHLSERWGKVRQDGVLLPLDLSHRLLGHARRRAAADRVERRRAPGRAGAGHPVCRRRLAAAPHVGAPRPARPCAEPRGRVDQRSRRLRTPSFCIARYRCASTVRTESTSWSAISALDSPRLARLTSWASRAVSVVAVASSPSIAGGSSPCPATCSSPTRVAARRAESCRPAATKSRAASAAARTA